MRGRGLLATLALTAACGPPALQNAPRPNPAVVAGAAAAVAGAATLANPDGAARKQEQKKETDRTPTGEPVTTTVPADVLDRLDAAKRAGPDRGKAPAAPDDQDAAPAEPAPPPAP